jgi:hypothetical protein
MALIKCEECGNEVSSKADACPKCGAKVGPEKVGCGKVLMVTFLGFVILVIGISIAGSMNDSGSSAPAPAKTPGQIAADKKQDEAVQRAIVGAMTLKKAMRDTDSFKLDSALVIDGSGAVCYDYHARNGFGGMNAGHAVLASNGTTLKSNEMDGFTHLWNKQCANKRGTEVEAAANRMLGL